MSLDPRSAMLSELSACAHRLGVAFGREAERAEDAAARLEYFRLFDRCFFAVRVGIALELRLRRAPAHEAYGAGDGSEREGAEREGERAEREGASDADRDRDREQDRDREAEPASLPLLLDALGGVAADAAALPGPEPAALPDLRGLLTRAARARAPSSSEPGLRARLVGSAIAVRPAPTARTSGRLASGPALAPRRATGPPRR